MEKINELEKVFGNRCKVYTNDILNILKDEKNGLNNLLLNVNINTEILKIVFLDAYDYVLHDFKKTTIYKEECKKITPGEEKKLQDKLNMMAVEAVKNLHENLNKDKTVALLIASTIKEITRKQNPYKVISSYSRKYIGDQDVTETMNSLLNAVVNSLLLIIEEKERDITNNVLKTIFRDILVLESLHVSYAKHYSRYDFTSEKKEKEERLTNANTALINIFNIAKDTLDYNVIGKNVSLHNFHQEMNWKIHKATTSKNIVVDIDEKEKQSQLLEESKKDIGFILIFSLYGNSDSKVLSKNIVSFISERFKMHDDLANSFKNEQFSEIWRKEYRAAIKNAGLKEIYKRYKAGTTSEGVEIIQLLRDLLEPKMINGESLLMEPLTRNYEAEKKENSRLDDKTDDLLIKYIIKFSKKSSKLKRGISTKEHDLHNEKGINLIFTPESENVYTLNCKIKKEIFKIQDDNIDIEALKDSIHDLLAVIFQKYSKSTEHIDRFEVEEELIDEITKAIKEKRLDAVLDNTEAEGQVKDLKARMKI